MTVRTAISSQFMFGEEITYGVPVVTDLGLPLMAGGDGLGLEIPEIESDSIYAGQRTQRESQTSLGKIDPGGDLGMELFHRGLKVLLKHMMGNVVTTGPVSGLYTSTFTPGELFGKSLTFQSGRTITSTGVVEPFTYPGGKPASWEISWEEGKNCTLGLTIVARDEILYRTVADGVTNSTATVTSATAAFDVDDLFKPVSGAGIPAATYVGVVNSATSIGLSSSNTANVPVVATATAAGVTLTLGIALATVSYPSSLLPFTYLGAAVTLAGQTFKVKKGKFAGDNKLDTDRYFGGSRLRDEPLEGTDVRAYTGQLDTEFFNLTAYKRFVTGTTASLVAQFALGTSTLTITENIKFLGKTPNPSDRGVIMQTLPFKALANPNDSGAITIVVVNADATP